MSVIAIAEIIGISGRHDELVDLLRRTEQRALRFPGARRYEFAARLAGRQCQHREDPQRVAHQSASRGSSGALISPSAPSAFTGRLA